MGHYQNMHQLPYGITNYIKQSGNVQMHGLSATYGMGAGCDWIKHGVCQDILGKQVLICKLNRIDGLVNIIKWDQPSSVVRGAFSIMH